jgi:hypothetical protein
MVMAISKWVLLFLVVSIAAGLWASLTAALAGFAFGYGGTQIEGGKTGDFL